MTRLTTLSRLSLALMFLALGTQADTIRWFQHVDGDWNDPNRWTNATISGGYPAGAPGTGDVVDITLHYTTTTQAVITLNSTMYPSGVTNLSWNLASAYSSIARGYMIDAYGTVEAPLSIDLTGPSTYSLRLYKGHEIVLNHVKLKLSGATDHALYVNDRIGGRAFSVAASNTDILISNPLPQMGLYLRSDAYSYTNPIYFGRISMTAGNLTVTNTTTNALILLSGVSAGAGFTLTESNITALTLSNTLLTADNVTVSPISLFRMNNGGLTATNQIKNTLLIDDGGMVIFSSGQFAIGTVDYGAIPVTTTGTVMVVNGATGTIGSITMRNTGTSYVPASFVVSNGAVEIGAIYLGAQAVGRDFHEFRLAGGSARVLGSTVLGRDNLNTRHGSGLMTMTGGAFESGNLTIGTIYASGYYEQAGGAATITNRLLLQTETTTYGARQFVVATNATLTLTGPGFAKAGTTAWNAELLDPTNLVFAGPVVFAPASGVTNQTLLAFGQAVGNDRAGLTNAFAMGTLDLSALDGVETLTVTNAGNFTPNALYIGKLLGLTPATAPARIKSALTLYYDPIGSPALGPDQSISLTGGGLLVALQGKKANGSLILIR